MPPLRHPAVAGKFYPHDAADLNFAVNSFLKAAPRKPALACVAPHAGYIYSGHVAGAVFSTLEIPSRVIMLCPNHTGRGQPLSIMSTGTWLTPLGEVSVAAHLAEQLKEEFFPLTEDTEAHRSEHAIEVELPFLQVLKPGFSFVPIALGTRNYEVLEALGFALANVIRQQDDPVLIIASSDMNHYENDDLTRVKDAKAIERILALDPSGLFSVAMKEDISMCGLGATVSALTAAKQLGASQAELIKYATSGDVSNDRDFVVGYAGILIS
jgi:AmmeMemoRadiSam system protein B